MFVTIFARYSRQNRMRSHMRTDRNSAAQIRVFVRRISNAQNNAPSGPIRSPYPGMFANYAQMLSPIRELGFYETETLVRFAQTYFAPKVLEQFMAPHHAQNTSDMVQYVLTSLLRGDRVSRAPAKYIGLCLSQTLLRGIHHKFGYGKVMPFFLSPCDVIAISTPVIQLQVTADSFSIAEYEISWQGDNDSNDNDMKFMSSLPDIETLP